MGGVVTSVTAAAAVLAFGLGAMAGDAPHLRKQGTATQLIVDGRPFVMLAGELHNSSASGLEYLRTVWPNLKALHLNTVLATVSWELVEPEEGRFDFSLVDGLLEQARANDLRLVLLWFGSWKNGVSSYAPAWVKKDIRRFPRALGASHRNTKDVLSTLADENWKADARAFAATMRHLRTVDGERHTVLMVQVENEVGIKPELRDLSPQADERFNAMVPARLVEYLQAHKDRLHPELRGLWEKTGFKASGTWPEVFGSGPQAAEIFSAWHYAVYINEVARAGKAEYPLPMYVNAWLRGPDDRPGTYPSGGPVAHVLDVWRAAAADIDLYAPDIYLGDFKGVCADYTSNGNPLMIPESRTDDEAVARAFWAVAQHDALCFSLFGIDHVDPGHPLGDGYAVLRQLLPLITTAQGTGRMAGIYRQTGGSDPAEEQVKLGEYRANIKYLKRGPARDVPPYGLIIQTGAEEFVLAGHGFEANFSATTPGPRHTGILSVELGHFDNGQWQRELRLNGDETGANNVARLPPNPGNTHLDPGKPRILKVKLYRYD